jgi:acid stress chaperone HdeB
MFVRMLIAAAVGLGSIAPLPTAAQDIDLASLKCTDFLKSDAETTRTIMLWMAGYYTYEDDPTVISPATLKRKEQQIKQYCADNQTMSLISAAEIFMDKKYNN